ncbi:MAG: hypothetical protein AAGJ56_04690 [Myxococcota bacterium]
MTIRVYHLAPLWIVLALVSTPALAKISDTTRSRAPGQLSLGGEFEAGLADEAPLTLNLHQEVGLRSGLDLVLDQRLRISDGDGALLAAGIKWTILNDNRRQPGLAAWFTGVYDTNTEDAGFRGHFMVDNTWGKFTPYLALDLDIIFRDDDTFTPFTLIGGSRIGLVRNVDLFVEGGLGLNEDTEFLSAGLRVTL